MAIESQLEAINQAELAEYRNEVILNHRIADRQLRSDMTVRQSSADGDNNLALPPRERRDSRSQFCRVRLGCSLCKHLQRSMRKCRDIDKAAPRLAFGILSIF